MILNTWNLKNIFIFLIFVGWGWLGKDQHQDWNGIGKRSGTSECKTFFRRSLNSGTMSIWWSTICPFCNFLCVSSRCIFWMWAHGVHKSRYAMIYLLSLCCGLHCCWYTVDIVNGKILGERLREGLRYFLTNFKAYFRGLFVKVQIDFENL